MRLAQFIAANMERILSEWDAFARTRTPAAADMDRRALRNAARELLESMCEHIETGEHAEGSRQTRQAPTAQDPEIAEHSREHASQRFGEGFTLNQMVSEYHALGQTVLRLWAQEESSLDRDVFTDVVRFDEALNQAQAESIRRYARELEQARELFMSALGHDLRSPLGAILLSAEFLLERDSLEGRQRKSAEQIHRSAIRMHHMIDDLRDFTRTRLGPGLPIAPSRFDPLELVREAVDEARSSHPEREVELEQPDHALTVTWDVSRIGQMLTNLIDNAMQYAEGNTSVLLRVREEPGDVVVLSVHNAGTSIPPSLQETIFDPFVRAGEPLSSGGRREGGLGLGLYIARQIAEAHGGTLNVVSSDPDATVFEARLPHHAQPSISTSGLT
jgi:signal transduction histidine kinase